MKKNIYILLLGFIVLYYQANAQKTGINKTNPTQALDVRGNIKGDSSLIIQPKSGNSDSTFIVTPAGKVGIGTSNPDGELEVHSGALAPIFTNLATNAASASGSSNTSSFGTASRAFDGNGTTDWYTGNTPNRLPAWLRYDFGTPTVITAYTLMQVATYNDEKPTAWTFEGSHDNVNWGILDTRTAQNISNDVASPSLYTFLNATAFRYYRINITANNGSISHAGITEMQIGTTTIPPISDFKIKNGNVSASSLQGIGTRMVVANSSGTLSTQAIPDAIPFSGLSTNYATRWNGSALTASSIFDNGNISIGSTFTPYRLNIQGAAFSMGNQAAFYTADRTNNAINAIYADNNSLRIWREVVGDLMSVHSNGRVGIGVSSPLARLHVAGDLQLQNGTAINEISTDTTLADNSNLAVPTERAIKKYVDNQINNITEIDPKIGTNTTNYLSKWSGTQLVTSTIFDNGFNVGIGTATPSSKFQVNSNNSGTGFVDWIAGNFGGQAGNRVVIGLLDGVPAIGGHNNALSAWSNLSINAFGGNVGIGTINPTSKLHVVGNTHNTGNLAIGEEFFIADLNVARTGNPKIAMLNNGVTTAGFMTDGNTKFNMVTDGSSIAFRTGVTWNGDWNTTGTERMIIQNTGNVGIGTNAPASRLQVGNNGDGTVAVANAWNTFSDARFKKNIRTLESPLEKIDSLRGVRYDWISSGKGDIGFIAQELEKIYPELVATGTDGYKSVDYARMTAILLQALKELKAKNEVLEANDKAKTSQLEQHEAAISSLKKDIEFLMQFYSQK
jgi:hypothetical protein